MFKPASIEFLQTRADGSFLINNDLTLSENAYGWEVVANVICIKTATYRSY